MAIHLNGSRMAKRLLKALKVDAGGSRKAEAI
jgi:hypothetical protein